jgi:hypothetical protein
VSQPNYCNLASVKSGEAIIGNAPHWQMALALEAPMREWDRFRSHRPEALNKAASSGLSFGMLLFETKHTATHSQRQLLRCQDNQLEALTSQDIEAELHAALLEPQHWQALAPTPKPERWLLTCTHGRVDAACAKFGIQAAQQLEAYSDVVALGRCAHFGGHRFAPTLVELPSLRFWGRLQPDTLSSLALQQGDLEQLLCTCYRGWAGLDGYTQLLERQAWLEHGWAWLGYRVSGAVVACEGEWDRQRFVYPSGQDNSPEWAEVRLEYQAPNGARGVYTGVVERCADVLSMGGTDGEAMTYKQFRLSSFRHATQQI